MVTVTSPVRQLSVKLRWMALALGIVFGAAAAVPGIAAVQEECAPGSSPTTGCRCTFEPDGFETCGCCTDADGNPTCLYCRVE